MAADEGCILQFCSNRVLCRFRITHFIRQHKPAKMFDFTIALALETGFKHFDRFLGLLVEVPPRCGHGRNPNVCGRP